MKNANIYLFCMTVLLTLFFVGCGTTTPSSSTNNASVDRDAVKTGDSSPGMDLDVIIKEAATQMEAKIPSGTMVALVSVASPSNAFSTQVLTRLESAIVSSGKLVVVDRANLDKIRAEQGFQLSGEVDDESAKSIGKLLGAGAIVTGALADLGDVYSLTLKAINMETATVAVSYLADLAKTSRIETLLASGGGASEARSSGAAQTVAGAQTAYKIGDTGPAGGLIFYDKGNNSDGWQYLEAAPASTEFTATWAPPGPSRSISYSRDNDDTIGKGLSNTKAIVAYFEGSGGGFNSAAWDCNDLVINGFDDWFLPSQAELGYMYGNLHRKGLGGFTNAYYWCSSQVLNSSGGRAIACVNFADGTQNYASYGYLTTEKYCVRAIRQF